MGIDARKNRLIIEKQELNEKLSKLLLFIDSDKIQLVSELQQSLLKVQAHSMQTYLQCLIQRIQYLEP